MDQENIVSLERLFLALADRTRLRLLALMANGEVSVGYLAGKLAESQPKVSRHLAYLRNAGLVDTRRDGKWVYYFIKPEGSSAAAGVMRAIFEQNNAQGRRFTPNLAAAGERSADTSAEVHMSEFHPNRIEIFLL